MFRKKLITINKPQTISENLLQLTTLYLQQREKLTEEERDIILHTLKILQLTLEKS